MLCNRCANTRCRKDVDHVITECNQHVPIKGGWTFWDVAAEHCEEELRTLLKLFNLQVSNKYKRRG